MSELELVLEGIICKTCCEWFNDIIDDVDAPGYPRNCTAKLKVLSSHSELEIGEYLRELKQTVNELTKAVHE